MKHTVSSILLDFLNQKKERTGSYSIRALARDLNLSAPFVSRAMAGQKKFTSEHLKKIFNILDIDKETQIEIKRIHLKEKIGILEYEKLTRSLKADSHMKFKKLSKRKLSVLSDWYYIAVLEAFTLSDFQDTPESLSTKLGISVLQVEQSLELLVRLKILNHENGTYRRDKRRIRLASSASQPEIRSYHQAMIQKAALELKKTDAISFNMRLITGITMGANTENLEKVKAILNEAIHKASEILGSESCDQVYQLNLQLFPLTKG